MPLKRNKNLILLSREHHFILLFCWKIRVGLTKNIDLSRLQDFCEHFWDNNLSLHFKKEEKKLFEKNKTDLIGQASEQHTVIRSLMRTIIYNDNNNPMAYTLLADTLEKHIRFEERKLFPAVEKILSEYELELIGRQLSAEKKSENKYGDEFWT